jgi:hypothetical protein
MVWIVIGITATVMSLRWLDSQRVTIYWMSSICLGPNATPATASMLINSIPGANERGVSGSETKFFGNIIEANYHFADERGDVVISNGSIYTRYVWAVLASGVAFTLFPLLVERIVFYWQQ